MKDFLKEDFERIALQERVLIEIENLAIQQQQWEEEQRKMIKPAKVIIQYDKSIQKEENLSSLAERN